jgi:hypothetical protein
MNKSPGPADLPAQEDKGPKVQGNQYRGDLTIFRGDHLKAPLIYGAISSGKIRQPAGWVLPTSKKTFHGSTPWVFGPPIKHEQWPILLVLRTHPPFGSSCLLSPRCGRRTSIYFQPKSPKKLFRSEKLACPLQEKFTRIFKEEESETAGRLKDGIITKETFFSTR